MVKTIRGFGSKLLTGDGRKNVGKHLDKQTGIGKIQKEMEPPKECPKCGGDLIEHPGICKCDLDWCTGQRCGATEKREKLFCPKCENH